MTNSYFFTFEGIEACGKSTQVKKILDWLNQEKGFQVHLLREPGGTEFGEKLRSAILSQNPSLPLHPLAQAHLFASARAQLLSEKVLPLLKQKNQIVILDRFIDSSIAYQGYAGGLGIQTILDLHAHSPLDLKPHLTFYLKISVETSQKRQESRGQNKDYFESKGKDFYHKLTQGYDKALELFPQRIKLIQAEETEDKVFQQIKKQLEEFFSHA